ncbi:hypothetical protein HKD37_18G051151 [Glycine soja]
MLAFPVLTFARFRSSKKSRKGKSPGKDSQGVLLLSPSALSSSLSQTGRRFCDCNHIVELVFLEFVSATYRLRSKKTTKGKGGKRFWKSIVVDFKTPREAIEEVALERSTPICASSSSNSVVYKSKAEPLEHTKKRDTGHQSVSLENKTGDSTVLKIGNSAKVVIKQDMKGRRHKYGFNNNKHEKAEKKRVVDDETGDKHQMDEIMGSPPASTPPPPPPPPPPPSPPSPPPPPPPSDASASSSAVKRTRKASHLRSRNLISQRLLIVGRKGSYCRPWGRDGGSLNQTSRGNGPLQPIRTVSRTPSVRNRASTRKSGPSFARLDVRKKAHAIQKQNTAPHILSRRGYDYLEQKLLAEKTKKKQEEAAQSGSVDGVIDPPSPVRCHVKWKLARMKKTGEMTTEAAKEIAEKIDSFKEQATQGSFVPHGRQDVLVAAIGRPEHPGRVRAARAGVTIKQYFGSAPRTSRSASSLPPNELQQLTQQIRDQLEKSITEKVTRQVMASFSHMQSQLLSQMQSQGLVVPPEPLVGPSGPRVSTKGSCVDPSGNDPETVYEGSTIVHNTPLLPSQVKVSVEEVTNADSLVPVPTDEVSLGGQALHTFLAWPTHLVKSLSPQVVVSPAKPPPKLDLEVDNPLYLMTLTIPELFLRPYQVRWDATVFGVFNPDFPLYIKHEDLSEIAHGGQCLSISSIQRSRQSQFESESYIKSWMQSSQRDVYLGAYLNGGHWRMVVILPKEHLVVWFCSLHNRPDNYLKGIINSAIKGLDDAPQPKSKASARWIVVKYFNDPRPLEPERLKALRIQWAQFYLRVGDQT